MGSGNESLLEAEWPETSKRLCVFLRARRTPASEIDDVIQETALRLLGMQDRIDPERPLWPLALTIALNVLRDSARRSGRVDLVADPPQTAASFDVEDLALVRMELARVEKALSELPDPQRQVLLREVADVAPLTDRSRDAAKVLRMRARRRLAAMVEHASASGVVAWTAVRDQLRALVYRVRPKADTKGIESFAPQLAAGVIVLATAVGFGSGVAPGVDLPEASAAETISPVLTDVEPIVRGGPARVAKVGSSDFPVVEKKDVKRSAPRRAPVQQPPGLRVPVGPPDGAGSDLEVSALGTYNSVSTGGGETRVCSNLTRSPGTGHCSAPDEPTEVRVRVEVQVGPYNQTIEIEPLRP